MSTISFIFATIGQFTLAFCMLFGTLWVLEKA